MALKFFAEQKCDLVIWETGLGGRLDATNIVTPLASVITNIASITQQWLGDTLRENRRRKGRHHQTRMCPSSPPRTNRGRAGSDCIDGAGEARAVDFGRMKRRSIVLSWTTLSCRCTGRTRNSTQRPPWRPCACSAAGCRSVTTILRQGCSPFDWPGRMQRVSTASGQIVLLDGAHNPASAEALRTALQAEYPDARPAVIFGVFRDKDSASMCHSLAPLAGRTAAHTGPQRPHRGPGPAGDGLSGGEPARVPRNLHLAGPGASKRPPANRSWSSPVRFIWSARRWKFWGFRPPTAENAP